VILEVAKVALLVKTPENLWECTRSALGLGVDNRQVGLFIINAEITSAPRGASLQESFEMLDDLDGVIISNSILNTNRYPLIKYMSLADISRQLLQYDLVVSF
jgi:hypothetical protein